MRLLHKIEPDGRGNGYELHGKVTHHPNFKTVELFTVWPEAKHNDPHRIAQINLPPEAVDRLQALLGENKNPITSVIEQRGMGGRATSAARQVLARGCSQTEAAADHEVNVSAVNRALKKIQGQAVCGHCGSIYAPHKQTS